MHWDGCGWTQATSPTTSNLDAVWGTGPNDVWAVGNGPFVHWGRDSVELD